MSPMCFAPDAAQAVPQRPALWRASRLFQPEGTPSRMALAQYVARPPDASNTPAVVKEHSSLASQAITAAISSTVPKRPIGIFESMKSMCCCDIWSKIAVRTAAGVIALTVMLDCASSLPSDLVKPIYRDLRKHEVDVLLRHLVKNRRAHRSGRDRVDRDVGLRQFLAERLGQTDDGGFGSAVRGGVWIAFLASDRGNVDDTAVVAGQHVRNDRAVAMEQPVQVHVDHLSPLLDRIRCQRHSRARDSGAGDQHVDAAAQMSCRCLGRSLARGPVGHVDPDARGAGAELARGPVERFLADVPEAHGPAFSDKAFGKRQADAGSPAGDHRTATGKAMGVVAGSHAACSHATTVCACRPSLSMPSVITSPGLR